ncbi:MAG: lycopene cyclase domain-containing protein, partial [Acidimicrobiales bacterium]
RQYQYVILMAGCLLLTLPLEFLFEARVWRQPRRLVRAAGPPLVIFGAWDYFATKAGHWSFNPELTTSLRLPGDIPIDEVLFFIVIPICALLTLEAVRNVVSGKVTVATLARKVGVGGRR